MQTYDAFGDHVSTAQATAGVASLADAGKVLSLFSDCERFVERLDYISQTMAKVEDAWAHPCLPDADAILGVLIELTKSSVVPAGCEDVHELLLEAMKRYREAAEGIQQAKLDARHSERDQAWQQVREANSLLSRSISMVSSDG